MRQIIGHACGEQARVLLHSAGGPGAPTVCQAPFKAQNRADKVPALSEPLGHCGKMKNNRK